MEIHPAARRHGIADEDILHATANAMTIEDLDDDLRLYLGPARNAELLEIVTVARDSRSDLVIHAMKMRDKYLPLIPGE